jgi:hypothetical protein
MWFCSLALSSVFLWSGRAYYSPYAQTESRQRLLDAGINAETAARAARYGRA